MMVLQNQNQNMNPRQPSMQRQMQPRQNILRSPGNGQYSNSAPLATNSETLRMLHLATQILMYNKMISKALKEEIFLSMAQHLLIISEPPKMETFNPLHNHLHFLPLPRTLHPMQLMETRPLTSSTNNSFVD